VATQIVQTRVDVEASTFTRHLHAVLQRLREIELSRPLKKSESGKSTFEKTIKRLCSIQTNRSLGHF
jgi:hypothetical protein